MIGVRKRPQVKVRGSSVVLVVPHPETVLTGEAAQKLAFDLVTAITWAEFSRGLDAGARMSTDTPPPPTSPDAAEREG